MAGLILSRVSQAIILMAIMSVAIFAAIFSIGNPVDLLTDSQMTPAQIDAIKQQLGLDQPIWQQYLNFLDHVVHGDFGTSFVYGRSAVQVVTERLPATLELAVLAIVISLLVGLPFGILAGLRPNGRLDRIVMSLSSLCFSMPTFWAGILLVLIFSVRLHWLPTNGRGQTELIFGVPISILNWDGLKHALLPAINLALPVMALLLRLTRAGVIENMRLDYIRFARAKGLSFRRIILVHLMRNILIPVITVTGLQFGTLIAFAVITESVFAWPGVGKLIVDSIVMLDRPVVVAHLIIVIALFSLINLVVDILYLIIDPRVRTQEA
jgi:peptide/nickel transport system permease protein